MLQLVRNFEFLSTLIHKSAPDQDCLWISHRKLSLKFQSQDAEPVQSMTPSQPSRASRGYSLRVLAEKITADLWQLERGPLLTNAMYTARE